MLPHGYSPEVDRAGPVRRGPGYPTLAVTNSHDQERYGTALLLEIPDFCHEETSLAVASRWHEP